MAGGGITFKLNENVAIRGEIEWADNIVKDREEKSIRSLKRTNADLLDQGETVRVSYAVNLNLITTSASLIWNF